MKTGEKIANVGVARGPFSFMMSKRFRETARRDAGEKPRVRPRAVVQAVRADDVRGCEPRYRRSISDRRRFGRDGTDGRGVVALVADADRRFAGGCAGGLEEFT